MDDLDDYLSILNRANTYLKDDNISLAKKEFNKVLKMDSNNTLALYGKSLCYFKESDYHRALKFADKALEISITSIPKRYYDRLLRHKKSAEDSDSKNAAYLLNRGFSLISKKQFIKAKSYFAEALKIQYSDDAVVGKAYCSHRLGNTSTARRLCKNIRRFNLEGFVLEYYDEIKGNSRSRSSKSGSSSSRSSKARINVLLDKGFDLIYQRKYDSAKYTFDSVLRLESNNYKAIVGKAYCFYCTNKIHRAQELCKKVNRNRLKGYILGYYDEIMNAQNNSTASSSENNVFEYEIERLLNRVIKLINNSNYGEAKSFCNMVLNLESNNVYAFIGKAYCFYKLGDIEKARKIIKDVENNDLSNPFLKYYNEIQRTVYQNTSGDSNSRYVSSLLNKGIHLINQDKFTQAKLHFDKVLRLKPNNVDAQIGKAYCYYCLGNFSRAYENFGKINSEYASNHFLNFYNKLLNGESSRNNDSSNNGASTDRISSFFKYALNKINNEDFKNAKKYFDKILSLESDNNDAIVGKAYCFYKLNSKFMANKLCENVVKSELSDPYLNFYENIMNTKSNTGSNTHYNNNQNSNSQSTKKEVNKLCDDGFKYIDNYKIKDAKLCFNKALKLNPNDPRAIYGNAVCFYNLGYYIPALKECDRALKIDKNSVDMSFYQKVKNKVNN